MESLTIKLTTSHNHGIGKTVHAYCSEQDDRTALEKLTDKFGDAETKERGIAGPATCWEHFWYNMSIEQAEFALNTEPLIDIYVNEEWIGHAGGLEKYKSEKLHAT